MQSISLLIIFLSLSFPQSLQGQRNVTVLTLDGTINPAAADYIIDGIKEAEKNKSQCLILKLNTPGGLLESTREIVSGFLQSPVPVIVYVSPPGARAASAGVFITMAADIAAMAPGTNIGAAHPVSMQGQMDSTVSEKATNDAAAFIRSISEKRNRNIKWAEEAVRNSISITASEALSKGVINIITPNLDSLLIQLNGKIIKTGSMTIEIHTAGARIVFFEMSFIQKLLSILSDPNFAYILFILGFYGILFELYNPGAILPGVVGVISLILAFYSLHTLPINYAGLALIVFGMILFILEIKITSHGILTVGGIIALTLGSMMLIKTGSEFQVLHLSGLVILSVVIVTVLFFTFAIGMGLKAQRKRPTTGVEGLINLEGEAITDLNPGGKVKVHGEIWKAVSIEGKIEKGNRVIISGISNLTLKIKKT